MLELLIAWLRELSPEELRLVFVVVQELRGERD